MSAHVTGLARRAEDGRIVTSESPDEEFVCSPGLEEVIITLSLSETEPEFVEWNLTQTPVFTKDENDLYQIVTNKVLIGGLFTGAEQVDISAEIVGFPLSLANNQFFEAEYQKPPVHSNPTNIYALVSNDKGQDERDIDLSFIDSAAPVLNSSIAYNRTATSDTIIQWDVEGADIVQFTYINTNGDEVELSDVVAPEVGELVIGSIYPDGGSIQFLFVNSIGDVLTNTIPVFPANFGETD